MVASRIMPSEVDSQHDNTETKSADLPVAEQQPEGLPGPAPASVLGAEEREQTSKALLGGEGSGALEAAVAKMDDREDTNNRKPKIQNRPRVRK